MGGAEEIGTKMECFWGEVRGGGKRPLDRANFPRKKGQKLLLRIGFVW
jgi:hypothetical protein